MCNKSMIAENRGVLSSEANEFSTDFMIAENQASYPFEDNEFFTKSQLPMCPHNCGPLAFKSRVTPYSDCGELRCLACNWNLTLLPDENRDLTEALMGLNPMLDLNVFIALAAQRNSDQEQADLKDLEAECKQARATYESLRDQAADAYEVWKNVSAATTGDFLHWSRNVLAAQRLSGRAGATISPVA